MIDLACVCHAGRERLVLHQVFDKESLERFVSLRLIALLRLLPPGALIFELVHIPWSMKDVKDVWWCEAVERLQL